MTPFEDIQPTKGKLPAWLATAAFGCAMVVLSVNYPDQPNHGLGQAWFLVAFLYGVGAIFGLASLVRERTIWLMGFVSFVINAVGLGWAIYNIVTQGVYTS